MVLQKLLVSQNFEVSFSQSKKSKCLGLAKKNASLAKSRIYHSPPLTQWKIITVNETYLQISSILVQQTLNNKYSLERRLLAPMQCNLKTTVNILEL